MIRKIAINITLLALIQFPLLGQMESYDIAKTSFSTNKYDEICPVFYGTGLVFSSNMNADLLLSYNSSGNKGLFSIFYTESGDDDRWTKPGLFSKNITTRYNDGPATFSRQNDTIYYSRNLNVEGRMLGVRNKLGIFYSTRDANDWGNIREMRINNTWYNVTTPYLSPDGKKLYFASDDPEGYGGMDLYVMNWMGRYWGDPVNLGPEINTEGNEAYPFINEAGELFFSSDGRGGLGGKDIFFSRMADNNWLNPVHIDAPVNSKYDDFGLITDLLMTEGYFASDRDGTFDIYHFETLLPQIFYTSLQKENQYCFIFNDSGAVKVDRNLIQHRWTFGDGESATGAVVEHCYPGPGDYMVQLDLVDKETGRVFSTKLKYRFRLRDFQQPYINAPDAGVKGELIEFDGLKSYLPGYEILDYSWDFGDGTRSVGSKTSHVYNESGEYEVNMGLAIKSETDGEVLKTGISKKINIFDSEQRKTAYNEEHNRTAGPVDVMEYSGADLDIICSIEKDLVDGAIFSVCILTSETRLSLNNRIFRNVPSKYSIREYFDEENNVYRYCVEWQMNLMAVYPAFKELSELGFNEAAVESLVISDPAERELYNLLKIYGNSADKYFSDDYRLKSHGLIMLDRLVSLMRNFPEINIEIRVHTDSTGTFESNLDVSQNRANAIINYLVNRGIDVDRLLATGFGESKHIAPNYLERDRELNRRIEFRIINN